MNWQRNLWPMPGPLCRQAVRFAERWGTGYSRYFQHLVELLVSSRNAHIQRICCIKSRTDPGSLVLELNPELTLSPETPGTFFPPELALPE